MDAYKKRGDGMDVEYINDLGDRAAWIVGHTMTDGTRYVMTQHGDGMSWECYELTNREQEANDSPYTIRRRCGLSERLGQPGSLISRWAERI